MTCAQEYRMHTWAGKRTFSGNMLRDRKISELMASCDYDAHGLMGWALCGATIGLAMAKTIRENALIIDAVAGTVVFMAVSFVYVRLPKQNIRIGSTIRFCTSDKQEPVMVYATIS